MIAWWSSRVLGVPLRPYQLEVAQAIVASVEQGRGDVITVMMARQMGKNEVSAHTEAYLLARFQSRGGTIIKAAPTFKPQLLNSRQRVERLLNAPLTRGRWQSSQGYMLSLGKASLHFLSAATTSSVVGATASLLLEMDEAQDLDEEKYQKDFRPMGSSTNATTVLYGTAWTADTLLAQEVLRNQAAEKRLGRQLHFSFPWTVLADTNPAYRAYVQSEIDRLGAQHPLIRTQYFLEELDREGHLFSAADLAKLAGTHSVRYLPDDGERYVAGIDVGGTRRKPREPYEHRSRADTDHDSTVITIARVLSIVGHSNGTEVVTMQGLHVVYQECWTGLEQRTQYERLLELARLWRLSRLVIDGSGLGAGLASWLQGTLGEDKVVSYIFTQKSKSDLGWNLLSVVGTGRLQLYADDGTSLSRRCWSELQEAVRELKGNELLNFFVPESKGHDDCLISLALCAHAARHVQPPSPTAGIIRPVHTYSDGRY